MIDTAEQARRSPELSVLSAMAHGRGEAGRAIGIAALTAAAGLAGESARLYADVVISCLSKAALQAVEEVMANGTYEYQSEFVQRLHAEGERLGAIHDRARSVLTVLEARGLQVSEAVRTRVLESRDLAELDIWLRRAVTVPSAAAVFDAGS